MPDTATPPSSAATSDLRSAAREHLSRLVGVAGADFHDGQFEAIEALVQDRSRALVVQRTGWGKSAVYFVATLLLRQQGLGPTLLVSPLLALMRDQVAAARRAGVRAVAMNSSNAHEWDDLLRALDADEVDLLLVSPERLNNPRFRDEQLPALRARLGLLVVDEAHCISDWGHDFRPDYRRLRDLISSVDERVPVLATTATANSRVVADVEEQLSVGSAGAGVVETDRVPVVTIRGPLARRSLRLGVLRLENSRDRLGWLLSHLDELPGSGIIYALTVSAAQDTARLLRDAGHAVKAYTGRDDPADREQAEGELQRNEVKALVATSALGMGFDKPDLGFVVHLGAPSSPVSYYQQVGRAGRGSADADVLLLPGREDPDIWQYFATASMPDEQQAAAVIQALGESDRPLSVPALESRVSLSRSRLDLLLKVLGVDGAVRRDTSGWSATGVPWVYDRARYEQVAAARVREQQAMLDYETTLGCRMEFLQRQLDDDTAAPCGRCDRCAGAWYPSSLDQQASATASQALDKVGLPIEPRLRWPTGASSVGVPLSGAIAAGEQVDEGRALARLTDLGWGGRLRAVFAAGAEDAPVDDALVAACVRVLAEWGWPERPRAVVHVPSASRPQLVGSLAQRIAEVGRLPFLGSLDLVDPGAPGAARGNSVYRLGRVHPRFQVPAHLADDLAADPRPVLLVDDLVDTRWTLTVAGRLLRKAGATRVLPFALAQQG
ncbi:RecQ family ATP-dependent DNA helicase [Clavibacter michiganensis]|uniref:DNA 3'-5' helicase n=3 Tax=Clavibacter michiganensis TaxID=28447 RepID=A0A0D5CFM4_9MICO|nr:DEAD/DEAH box helicase [Clavibacter michiganensis]AJW78095.1 ATP-dependent DNA helicase RecQ [Clavibacter michiganensis subsp. insidiosus]AWF99514.1 ATP-dependent DNA helicase RecQ [Clavibacter michiganensis subsp. insidiosus]AWG00366.1 ATP-dependent DNA helicase RecQ [Clavibacter michiganensis subsp. insidiosus]OQJ61000.1 recombinase RecQ [Clavibacter michiganensis subsp. insidiosus]RMC85856.1 DEAD/DEAH box helicase [Clavibacter michiganensis subsp. insidiosus]